MRKHPGGHERELRSHGHEPSPVCATTPARESAEARAVTPASLRAAVAIALEARRRVLSLSAERIVDALASTARAWSDRQLPERVRVTQALAATNGMHADMLACGLDFLFASIDHEALNALLDETGDPVALASPRVVFHSLAGNVPGLALPAIAASVLARSVTIVRDSARQPALTEAFLATLAAREPDVAGMVVPVAWAAGDTACERAALALADRAELYGSDATLRQLRQRHRDAHAVCVERGTRMSVGMVPACADLDRVHEGFALDTVLYDGQGCLTPHAILVALPSRALELAEGLAQSLDALEARWPRIPRSFEEEATRRVFVDACEAACAASEHEHLWRGKRDAWVVHLARGATPTLGPGLRCVRIITCENDESAFTSLAAAPVPLAGVGLGLSQHHAQYDRFVSRLRACGATLVCAPGRMQAPPLTWTQDGRQRLEDPASWKTEKT